MAHYEKQEKQEDPTSIPLPPMPHGQGWDMQPLVSLVFRNVPSLYHIPLHFGEMTFTYFWLYSGAKLPETHEYC